MSQSARVKSAPPQIEPIRRCPKVVAFWVNMGPYHYARARALSQRFEFTAIQLAASDGDAGWEPGSILEEIDAITLADRPWGETGQLSASLRLWRALDQLKPEYILVPGHGTLVSFVAAAWSRLHRARTLLMTDSTYLDRPRHRWKEYLKSLLLRLSFDYAAVAGSRSLAYLKSLGFGSGRAAIIGTVVDNDFFSNGVAHLRSERCRSQFGLPDRYLLYVGRFVPEKNLPLLVRCFVDYRRQGGKCELVLVGSGPLRPSVESQVAVSGVTSLVRFVDRKDAKGLLPYFAFAHCLVLPSVSETWGLVVNEALACGLPVVVSSACGCAPDLVVHRSNGFVFDPENEGDLTACLREIDEMDEKTLRFLGDRARLAAASMSLEHWAETLERQITDIGALGQ